VGTGSELVHGGPFVVVSPIPIVDGLSPFPTAAPGTAGIDVPSDGLVVRTA
jgi:hypothetical protein